MDESTADIYHVSRDAEYLRQLEEEAAFWDRPQAFSTAAELPVLNPYLNERFAGDASVAWFETIPRYGTFRRGLALGTGGLRLEVSILQQNPALHLTFYDISEESLAMRERRLGARFPGRVETRQADLNFVELPENAYDLIVSMSCLHHLLNLEHIAYQINRSLTPQGHFFLYDYVGEARLQFAEEKKRLFEVLLQGAEARHPFLRSLRVAWPDPSNSAEYSPFEAIRSEDTLEILRRYLTQVSLRTGGALLPLLIWLRPVAASAPGSGPVWHRGLDAVAGWLRGLRGDSRVADVPDIMRRLGPDLLPLERALSEAGILQPAIAFGVYTKKQPARLPVNDPSVASEEPV